MKSQSRDKLTLTLERFCTFSWSFVFEVVVEAFAGWLIDASERHFQAALFI